MPIEKSAGTVLFRKEKDAIKYLFLLYDAGYWDFAKGKIEKGETSEEAARRETREETGIKDIEFIPGFKETIKYFYKYNGKNFFKVVVFFLARTRETKVKISFEHKDFKWLPCGEALKQLTFDNAKRILRKADNFLNN